MVIKKYKYPLAEILFIKKTHLEKAERVFMEKKRLHDTARKELVKAEKALKEIKAVKAEKLKKALEEIHAGTTSTTIGIHERYMQDVIDEKIKAELANQQSKQKIFDQAKIELEKARNMVVQKNKEVEKLSTHKLEWQREVQKEIDHLMEIENDEIGTVGFIKKQKESS